MVRLFTEDMIIELLNALVQNDIDTDGDGNLHAASIGLKFESIPAHIVGVK